jgi:LacI family transcriptional regulator
MSVLDIFAAAKETPCMARATIEDVAARAGVSVATVDRVLNARAKVRPANATRVEAAIRALSYQPDRLAARLARKRDYRFCFVLPRGDNMFMRNLSGEISSHSQHLAAERVAVDILYTDVFDARALATSLNGLGDGYHGVAIVALDHPQVREAIAGLLQRGLAVVTLVSDVPGADRLHYVGVDNSAAGRTAATLMGRYLGGRPGEIGVIAGALALRDHAERHYGFQQVMQGEFPHLKLLPVQEGRDNGTVTGEVAARLLDQNPSLVGLYNIGGGTDGLVRALTAHKQAQNVVCVAHELNPVTRKALLDGTIDVVIGQDAGHEARSAMRVLMAHCDSQPIIAAQERIGIDIYVRDNLP